MFIQTEVTPNPATLNSPRPPVMDEGTFEARDEAQAERSPLAKALMQLPGVAACSSPRTSFRSPRPKATGSI